MSDTPHRKLADYRGENYPRDMIGYGAAPPDPQWPGGAKIAVQFVLNYEEGSENNVLENDRASETFLSEMIGAQAFQAVPRIHAIAVVAAILPNLAEWGRGMIDNALSAAGTTAEEVGAEALGNAGLVYDGLKTLGEGAVLVGLVLGTIVTFILDKKFHFAAIACAVGAVLSFIGLIHAPEVSWAAAPEVALGYLFFGLVCIAYWFLPNARTPRTFDEADVVAGH